MNSGGSGSREVIENHPRGKSAHAAAAASTHASLGPIKNMKTAQEEHEAGVDNDNDRSNMDHKGLFHVFRPKPQGVL